MKTLHRLLWKGDLVKQAAVRAAINAITEIDGRIETEAKRELYPGHGKRSGTLQRSIQGQPGVLDGDRVRGRVGTKGVRYALIIHKRYNYIVEGLQKVKPNTAAILGKHLKKELKG